MPISEDCLSRIKKMEEKNVIHVWFCKDCGTKWDEWMKYCPVHGTKLEWFDYP